MTAARRTVACAEGACEGRTSRRRRARAARVAGTVLAVVGLCLATIPGIVQAQRAPLPHQQWFPGQYPPCQNYEDNFDQPSKLINWTNWQNLPDQQAWISEAYPNNEITGGELVLRLIGQQVSGGTEGQNNIVAWSRWFHYGKIEATMRIGKGAGVVSALVVDSFTPTASPGDELDQEWTGQLTSTYQSNWFSLGVLNYDNGAGGTKYGNGESYTASGADFAADFHVFGIERTADYVRWFVDGKQVRELTKASAGALFPDRLGAVLFNIWDAGLQAQGTRDWAGGSTDWSKNPNPNYEVHVKKFSVTCYDSPGNYTKPVIANISSIPTRTVSQTVNGTYWNRPTAPYAITETFAVPVTTAAAGGSGSGPTTAGGLGVVTAAPSATRTARPSGSLSAAGQNSDVTGTGATIAGLPVAAVAGIIGGAVALVAVVAGVIIYRRRRYRYHNPSRTASQRRWAQTIASLDPTPGRWGPPPEEEIGLHPGYDAYEPFEMGRPSTGSMESVDVGGGGRPSGVGGRPSDVGRPSVGGDERTGLVGK